MNLEALSTREGREIFLSLKNFREFYLAGDAALALQLGHRQVGELQMWSAQRFPADLQKRIEQVFAGKRLAFQESGGETLVVTVESIKITFRHEPFRPQLSLVSFEGVQMLNIKELAAEKARKITTKEAYEDYVDLYFVLSEGHAKLEEIIDIGERKYGPSFNENFFVDEISDIDDVHEPSMLFLKRRPDALELENFFKEQMKGMKT